MASGLRLLVRRRLRLSRMMSAFVALDKATIENGCLQVLKSSHALGRLDHGKVGCQMGTDSNRLAQVEPLFERVHCTMIPGSVLFFYAICFTPARPMFRISRAARSLKSLWIPRRLRRGGMSATAQPLVKLRELQ